MADNLPVEALTQVFLSAIGFADKQSFPPKHWRLNRLNIHSICRQVLYLPQHWRTNCFICHTIGGQIVLRNT